MNRLKNYARVTGYREHHSKSRINETNEQDMKRLNHNQEQHSFTRFVKSVERLANDS
jgi:hypothetical protein